VLLAGLLLGLGGCSRFRPKPQHAKVYVTAKKTFLRDRVAAVSNRTATVSNGDELEVLDHNRRFLRVKTAAGETGWIDERAVATAEEYGQFETLKHEHAKDPVVATAVVSDDVYLHVKPGRKTDRFFLLAENDKLQLLARASVPRVSENAQRTVEVKDGEPAPPPVMEDWWLARDAKGDTGWIYSRLMNVDTPTALDRYSEGQRIVGAYVLKKVNDPDAEQTDKDIPEYVTVTSPSKAGLPYDFDQVRVFTWNVKKHHYETAFRDRNIEGYLPLEVTTGTDPNGKGPAAMMVAPMFHYRVLAADSAPVVPDPVTGAIVPGKTIVKTYRLEGNLVRRVLPPGTTAPEEAHPVVVEKKKVAAKGRKRR
jgi:SH3-like domain-containing protein